MGEEAGSGILEPGPAGPRTGLGWYECLLSWPGLVSDPPDLLESLR